MSDSSQANSSGAGIEEWLLTVSESDFQTVKLERLLVQTGPTRDFVVTVDKAARTPLKIEVRPAEGGRRALTPEEYNGLIGAYVAALSASAYGKMLADAVQYWQAYSGGAPETAAGAVLSPEELAYYQAIAIPR